MLNVKGKKILIMGLGLHGGGVGAARFFAERGARVTVTDLRTEAQLEPSLAKLKEFSAIFYVLGRHRESDFLHADLIIKNPGVPPTSVYIKLAREKGIPVSSDVSIFLRECPAIIIGVTGTRGKSTTCSLISRFLEAHFKKDKKQKNRRVYLGGNIRTSALEFIDTVTSRDIVILELSSFQLDDLARDSWKENIGARKSPHIALITNILRDHLNWHGTMSEYIKAKSIIFSHQTRDDVLIANGSDLVVKKMVKSAKSHVIFPRLASEFKTMVDANLGTHYRSSTALAIAAALHFDVPKTTITSVLKKFQGLPGRQETIAHIQGVTFINDTTATIPDAAIAALTRFRLRTEKHCLILIAGGSDKKLQFSEFAQAIHHYVDHLILLPGTATDQLLCSMKKIEDIHSPMRSLQTVPSMEQAVSSAVSIATKGDYVVLTPGAASFGLFANEFDRGDKFIVAVKKFK